MNKIERNAVRCFCFKGDKVLVTKYKNGNKKAGYYEIPGGKIEEGETLNQAVIREVKEETGIVVKTMKQKGIMTVEYPNKKFIFNTFISNKFDGEPQDFEDNTSEWMDIKELLQKEKILSNIMILDRFFIKGLIDENYNFKMNIKVDEQENILEVEYRLV